VPNKATDKPTSAPILPTTIGLSPVAGERAVVAEMLYNSGGDTVAETLDTATPVAAAASDARAAVKLG
jgi:hypothetical protein